MTYKDIHQHHIEHWENSAADESRAEIQKSWFRDDTVDVWRNTRMYDSVDCFNHRPELSFLTVGDGRFGLDAIRISQKGFNNVTATDISDALLSQAKEKGLISKYLIENAESLSLPDDSYDVVFCKESYHHFPRAPLALYEMLRVCKLATILIEPRDIDIGTICMSFTKTLRHLLSIMRFKLFPSWQKTPTNTELYSDGAKADYETSGNYIYSLSPREVEKIALGSNMPAVAFKGIGDFYIKGGEFAELDSAIGKAIMTKIDSQEKAFRAGSRATAMLASIIFKVMPDEETCMRLEAEGYYVKKLPRNPYIT
ncbi:class I SAM-dependent methyltransferase [Kiloniella antarctica]|uniref:Class I SAM-dependent methyltransferase n=1 Tax=Kiloniella antarctica TaxID=1550907 RepID=A0ABW5BR03_9PROT